MHRRVNDIEVFLAQNDVLVDHRFLDSLQVVPVHLATDDVDEFLVALKLHVVDGHFVDLVDDAFVVRSEHLSTVIPVSLVAVILTRIVGCCDIDTGLAAQLTDGERDLGGGSEALEEIYLDAIGGENISHCLGEHPTVVAAVVTDDHAEVITARESLEDVVGEALSSHADDILIHTVGASAHDAAQTACAEFEVAVECVDEFGLVVIVKHGLDSLSCLFIE